MFPSRLIRRTLSTALAAAACLQAAGTLAQVPDRAPDAKQILDASGVQGGLVVVIGCDSPELLAELRAGESYLVHGLDRDSMKVSAARAYLRAMGLYGSVTAARWDGPELPYVDSLVRLVVLAGDARPISEKEIVRVLAPLGVIVDARKGQLEVTRKPWPVELDRWSHFLHDASNNAVSCDTVVGPPQGLRWTCGPEYARSHEHFASLSAMVTVGGRVFTIIDEGPVSSVYLPPQWKLAARDAFSGVLLWKRPIANWESHLRGFRSGPPEIGRRMVAADERVYVALGYGEPVTVLDAATGKQVMTCSGTDGARELLLAGGVLYVLADDMTAQEHDDRKKRINQVAPTLEIWYRYPREVIPMYGLQRIVAIDSGSGGLLWKHDFEAPGEILPTTMAAAGGRLCLQTVSHVVCLDAAAGKELWRSDRPVARSRFSWSTPTLVIHDGVVLSLDRQASDNVGKSPPDRGSEWIISSGGFEDRQNAELTAFSLDDGKELWRAPYSENYNTPGDVLVIGGVVWVGDLRGGRDPGFTEGRDLKTGEVAATIPPQKAWGHHRCYRNKATVNWLMVGRGGIQFIDPTSGAVHGDSWYRGACQYGAMPANGLVYAPQHSCACQPEELLIGLNALSPQSSVGEGPPPLEKGPAYDSGFAPPAPRSAPCRDWPTYRGDARRSGHQDLAAPSQAGVAWTTRLSSPITAPVAAGGLVLVAETDRHTLHALSAAEGRSAWTFVADGRIDSPPTLSGGLCLFGTRNGFVYCLRASDGTPVWRFRAAPRDRRLFAYEQLESVWPVHGSVLVDDGISGGVATAYFAAGRSSYLDGGIRLYALEVRTGKVLHTTDVCATAGVGGAVVIRQGALPDILSAQKDAVWMRNLGVDRSLALVPDQAHLYAPRGFLDDTWWHRTYWIYGTAMAGGYQGWPLAGNAVPAGRLLVFDGGEAVYGYGRMTYREGGGHVSPQAANDYRLFAEVPRPESESAERAEDENERPRRPSGRREIRWTSRLPFAATSMVLASDGLLVAGGHSLPGSTASDGSGILWIVSREDGAKRGEYPLPAAPILDGMAFAESGIFISTTDGTLICLRPKNGE